MRIGIARLLATVGCVAAAVVPITASASVTADGHYDHVFLIVEENNGFSDIIGNAAAPNFNRLADTYGLATDYYAVSHPSEPNYVAMLGGDTFGIHDDNPYFVNTVNAPSLISQLDAAGIGWKAYLQSTPHAGYQGMCYPAKCNGTPDSDPLYVAKHNGIVNFTPDHTAADWSRQVPYTQLAADLRSSQIPRFGYIVPDECHDQHGDPPFCLDSGSIGDPQNQHLVATGDAFLGNTVAAITDAPFWSRGNNAIVVTYDEGDDNAHGGGRVATVVVTSHGARGLKDGSFYTHYSLLATLERNFGVGCLAHACDKDITVLTPLLAVTGSRSEPYHAVATPFYATPSPVPAEPTTYTTGTPSTDGWSVVSGPIYGTNDNSLGAIAANGPGDIWAVGNFLPDTSTSNQDATLTLTDHYDGHAWSVVPTPRVGVNFDTLFGVATAGGRAWVAGVYLDSSFRDRALVEAWNGTAWTVVDVPQPGSERDILYGITALSPTDVWAVGDQQGPDGVFRTLTEHYDGHHWTVVPGPDPGGAGTVLHAVAAASSDDVYAVGQRLDASGDQGIVEHWDGRRWSVVGTPRTSGSTSLYGVAVSGGAVYAVGESESPAAGAVPVVLYTDNGPWRQVALPSTGSRWTDAYGVAVQGGRAVVVGTALDAHTDLNVPVTLTGTGATGWHTVAGPNPGGTAGNTILGAVTDVDGTLWAAGTYDTGNQRLPLLEHN